MRRIPAAVGFAATVAGLSLCAAGCGGGDSPAVAKVASTTTTIVTTTTTQSGSGGGGLSEGGSSAVPQGGGNHTVMMAGNAVQGTKFAACMRTRRVPNFPDPNAQGMIQFGSGIDPRSPAFRSALSACRKLLPSGFGQPPTVAQLAEVQQQLLAFSTCMRAHGIRDFPDPTGGGLPQTQPAGDLDPNNPQFQAAYSACTGHLPAGIPAKALGGLTPPATGRSGGG
jgi:hypothetical protein